MASNVNEKDSALLQLQLQRGRASLQEAATLGATLASAAGVPADDTPQTQYANAQDRHVFRNTAKPGYVPEDGPQPGAFPQPVQQADVTPAPQALSEIQTNLADIDDEEARRQLEEEADDNNDEEDGWWKKYPLLQELERRDVFCICLITALLLLLVISMSVALGVRSLGASEVAMVTTTKPQIRQPTQPMPVSSQPSRSPSFHPSGTPSVSSRPSDTPSVQPSNPPSVSSAPSMGPSISSTPTLAPSMAPTSLRHIRVWELLPRETQLAIHADKTNSIPQSRAYYFVLDGHSAYPDWRTKQRFALATLFYATNGDTWTENRRWLNPDIHECHWYYNTQRGREGPCGSEDQFFTLNTGVYESISLYSNNLVSTLFLFPTEIYTLLPNLKHLDLGVNDLEGSLPASWPSNLEWLNLQRNGIEGPIPSELGLLSKLTWLSLSSNKLSSSIPTEVGNLVSLERLEFNINNLDATIPSELAQLTQLESLFLDRNRLTGTIPHELGTMVNGSLTTFTMDWNSALQGEIPEDLCRLGDGRLVFDCSNEGLCGCSWCRCGGNNEP